MPHSGTTCSFSNGPPISPSPTQIVACRSPRQPPKERKCTTMRRKMKQMKMTRKTTTSTTY
eukprot:scaffold3878_cov93-Cylindrotheca_fusiformis.AAC.1